MATRRKREEFIAILTRELHNESIGEVLAFAEMLMRLSATYLRLQENFCNVDMTEIQEKAHEAKESRTEKRIVGICKPYGITPVFSGDPRGATVKLKVPSGHTNDWGETGICVPTS